MTEQANRDRDDTSGKQQRPPSPDETAPDESAPTTPGGTHTADDDTSDEQADDDEVNEASEESFPASDPPAWTGATVDSH